MLEQASVIKITLKVRFDYPDMDGKMAQDGEIKVVSVDDESEILGSAGQFAVFCTSDSSPTIIYRFKDKMFVDREAMETWARDWIVSRMYLALIK